MIAVRMNAREMKPDIGLRVRLNNTNSEYFETEEFRRLCLLTPCHGCGSNEHALLEPILQGGLTNHTIYDYRCGIVSHAPLYSSDDGLGIQIDYFLNAERYAEDCNYEEEEAIRRVPTLGRVSDGSAYPPYMDSFMNTVKALCRQKTLQRRL